MAWIAKVKTGMFDLKNDLGLTAILALIILIAVWLLLMPIVPAIAATTMRRFHLRSGSFARFAIQFPIPAMYNFSNRRDVKNFPPGLVDPILGLIDDGKTSHYINHFPAREITFSVGRYHFLRHGKDRWFTIDSSYRGQTLHSTTHLRAREDSGFDFLRLEDK